MNDPHDLARFTDAQEGVWERALGELRAGRKQSHWMWFVFPQIAGLGSSPMAQHYAIASLEEARAYLAHAVLGARLRAGVTAVLSHPQLTARQIFGAPDDMKFRSSLTLFAAVAPEEPAFVEALRVFYGGEPDPQTLARISWRRPCR